MDEVAEVVRDLADEHEALDAVLAELSPERWHTDTPSPGWTVADQVGHLAYFDDTARVAITEQGFAIRTPFFFFCASTGSVGLALVF